MVCQQVHLLVEPHILAEHHQLAVLIGEDPDHTDHSILVDGLSSVTRHLGESLDQNSQFQKS